MQKLLNRIDTVITNFVLNKNCSILSLFLKNIILYYVRIWLEIYTTIK